MSHLPECGVSFACGVCGNLSNTRCICRQLRACEQRVLDAAREVVAALPEYQMRDKCSPLSTHYEGREMMKQDNFTQGLWIGWTIGTSMLLIPIIFLAVTQ